MLLIEEYPKIIGHNDSIFVQTVYQGDLYYVYRSIERAAIAQVSDSVKWHLIKSFE